MEYNELASEESIHKTIAALQFNGMHAVLVDNGAEAKKKVLELIPEGAEVFNATSVTLENIGVVHEIMESGKYKPVKAKLATMDHNTQKLEMNKLGSAPEYSIGSVHAVTEGGQVLIASNTGSQLPGYAHGALHVIWVVGTQKIVPDLDTAFKRIYDYVLPLESDRARKAYGTTGSNVSKLLIVNKEVSPGRINIIFVNEDLGY